MSPRPLLLVLGFQSALGVAAYSTDLGGVRVLTFCQLLKVGSAK